MVDNSHKIPKKQWRRWSEDQRALFNGVYEDILAVGSDAWLHPVTVQRKLSADEFNTIAWNAAWTAAHLLKGERTGEVQTIHEGEVIAVKKVA